MTYNLLVVESPSKQKTISKFLNSQNIHGQQWKILATRGYVKDLPKKEYALSFKGQDIDVKWIKTDGFKDFDKEYKKIAKDINIVYLALDDDREGEKIAIDLVEHYNFSKYKRVCFNEITKNAVINSLDNPRPINHGVVNVAVNRRILDRDNGYGLSPVLRFWLRQNDIEFPSNIGVGRVISPALHLLHLNQIAKDEFEARKYYRIRIDYQVNGVVFKIFHDTKFYMDEQESLSQLEMVIRQLKTEIHVVSRFNSDSEEKRAPQPLFTAELQNSAFNLYKFKGEHTMKLAQDLYELGYITYLRTDSNKVSDNAYLDLIEFLTSRYSSEKILTTKAKYPKRKNAKEAHECIRPKKFELSYEPDNIMNIWKQNRQDKLTDDHRKLYELIWYRTIATQFKPAIYDKTEVTIDVKGNQLHLKSQNVFETGIDDEGNEYQEKGWLTVKENLLKTSLIESGDYFKEQIVHVPYMNVDDELKPILIELETSTTKEPHAYGEGRFTKKIEAMNIARPSTLHTIIPNLEKKKLIRRVGDVLIITPLGILVDKWTSEYAPFLNDPERASEFEDELDRLEDEDEYAARKLSLGNHNLIEEVKARVGYVEDKYDKPTSDQLEYAKNLAINNNVIFDSSLFKTREKIEEFINKYKPKEKNQSLGVCPQCNKGKIFEHEKVFSCSEFKNSGCKFSLWKKNMITFFENKGKHIDQIFLTELMKACLRKKSVGMPVKKLLSQDGKTYDSIIIVKKNDKGYWNLALNFPKNLKQRIESLEDVEEVQEEVMTEETIQEELPLVCSLTNIENENSLNLFLSEMNSKESDYKSTIAIVSLQVDTSFININSNEETYNNAKKLISNNLLAALESTKKSRKIFIREDGSFIIIGRTGNKESFMRSLIQLKKEMENKTIDLDNQKNLTKMSLGVSFFKQFEDDMGLLIQRVTKNREKSFEEGNVMITDLNNGGIV